MPCCLRQCRAVSVKVVAVSVNAIVVSVNAIVVSVNAVAVFVKAIAVSVKAVAVSVKAPLPLYHSNVGAKPAPMAKNTHPGNTLSSKRETHITLSP
jgi:integrin beta 3